MPTCENCLHVELCKEDLKNIMKDMGSLNVQEVIELGLNNHNKGCKFFMDRSKFVDVSELQQKVIRPLTNRCAEYTKCQMCLACVLEIREHCEHYKKVEQALKECEKE